MMHFSCENEFCIYQKEGHCVLDSIELDAKGNCRESITIEVEKNLLISLKEKLLKEMQDRI